MFEDDRKCIYCGRVTGWTEAVMKCSDQKTVYQNCLEIANFQKSSFTGGMPWFFMKR